MPFRPSPLLSFLLLFFATFTLADIGSETDWISLMPCSDHTTTTRPGPGSVPLDVDGYPLAPLELELQQVHVYVRHGKCTEALRGADNL